MRVLDPADKGGAQEPNVTELKDGRISISVNSNEVFAARTISEETQRRTAIEAAERVASEDFEGAMRALARLRAPVDEFFLKVTVNADDPELRLNRLRLLGELRDAVHTVADFSKIAG